MGTPVPHCWEIDVRLKVLSNYSNQSVTFDADQVIEVDEAMARWLMSDAPGCFEPEADKQPEPDNAESDEPEDKAVSEPPQDKMQRSSRRKRSKSSNG